MGRRRGRCRRARSTRWRRCSRRCVVDVEALSRTQDHRKEEIHTDVDSRSSLPKHPRLYQWTNTFIIIISSSHCACSCGVPLPLLLPACCMTALWARLSRVFSLDFVGLRMEVVASSLSFRCVGLLLRMLARWMGLVWSVGYPALLSFYFSLMFSFFPTRIHPLNPY